MRQCIIRVGKLVGTHCLKRKKDLRINISFDERLRKFPILV